MQIQCEHIISGRFDGAGIKILRSPRVYQLEEDSLRQLLQQGAGLEGERRTVKFLDKEKLVAISYLRSDLDEYQRRGVWIHSILVPINEYLKATHPIEMFESYFIKSMSAPKPLEALKVNI